MTADQEESRDEPLILHCFADYGVESEILSWYGDVVRVGIGVHDTNESEPVKADAHILDDDKEWDIPFKENLTFDLGVFHPVCSKWAATTSISGDPDEHTNMIPSARSIAERYCDHYVIENVPRAPLEDPIVLDGRMFGISIKYERAFETNFDVPQPPRYQRFWGKDGDTDTAETSSFFFTERSRKWWASVKSVPPRDYPKQHLAKNTIPGQYIHHVCRAWLAVYEEDNDIDYSDYDQEMKTQRRRDANRSLSDYASGSDNTYDEDFRRAFRSNLEPIEEFRGELENFGQNSRVFMKTLGEIDENIELIRDTLSELEDTHYDLTALKMEVGDASSSSDTTDMQRLEQELDSIVQSLLSEVESLEDDVERLMRLSEDSQDRLMSLEERSKEFKVVFGKQVKGVQQWIKRLEERHSASRRLADLTGDLFHTVDNLSQTRIDQQEEWEDRITEISSILREFRDNVEDLREWRNQRVHGRTANLAFREFSQFNFDPGMRDTVVDSIAFFLRATSVVGANPERILEKAITANIQTQQRDRVLDTVDVTIETEDRERALESADEKHSYEQFSNAELRALLESEEERLDRIAERVRPSHEDLIDRVLDEPSYVEEGLNITAMNVPIEYHDLEIQVDLIGEDADQRLVLIDVIEAASRESIERKMNQLKTLLEEGDIGEERPTRGLVIVDTITEDAARQHTLESAPISGVEVRKVKQ